MVHLHKKISHYLIKHRTKLATFTALLSIVFILTGVFFTTKGTNPHTSELAFIEHSSMGIGSIIPASCESNPNVANGDGNYTGCATVTCWNGSVITPAAGESCPAQTTCTTSTFPNSSTTAIPNGSCSSTWTTTHTSCTDGSTSNSDGPTNTSCSCNSGYVWDGSSCVATNCTNGATDSPSCTSCPNNYVMVSGTCQYDSCAALDASLYCTTQSCTTLTGVTRYGTTNCSAGGTCTDTTAANYGGALPCVPVGTPADTCQDPNAENYGATGGCTYPPTLTAKISQSTQKTSPGVSWTLTWSSVVASSCTVTYTGPDGGGTISSGPKSGTKTMTLTPLGTYVFKNTCTDGSGTDSRTVTHYVVIPDLTAGPVTPTTVMMNTTNTFSSTISNIGGADTPSTFKNLFQLATGPGGTGTITDIGSTTMSKLSANRTSREDFSYKFVGAGTYYVRVCADKSSMNDSGTVNEGTSGGENNNCGAWTTINVTDGSCDLPWGGTIPNGSSTTAWKVPTVSATDNCNKYDQTRHCSNSVLDGTYQYGSCGTAVPVTGFSISPRTVEKGGLAKLAWSIQNPTASCKITAAVQIPATCDATCQANRSTASTTINNTLKSGTTNSNDPNGSSRNMTTAITTAIGSTGFAKGEKSINLDYTTTFTLTCGTTQTTSKTIIYVSERTEG
jgi:hypothetical protein